MNSFTLPQIIGNVCAALATFLFLFPLQKVLWAHADKNPSTNDWVPSVLYLLIPQWLLLLGALLCVTATGGFEWLRLGRTTLYTLTVAAAMALATVSFVFIGLFIRPGFTPRGLYLPFIYLVTFSTVLLVGLILNQKFTSGIPIQWLRWPWTICTGVSVALCTLFLGYQLFNLGTGGVSQVFHRIANFVPSSKDRLAKIAALDPQNNFTELLWQANGHAPREVREAATIRLRSNPNFLEQLSAELETGHVEPAVSFLCDATLTPEEQKQLARPARQAMERWVNRIPAPNYTTKKHLKDLHRWGTKVFRVLPEKFAGTGVNFGPVMEDFKDKVETKHP